VPNTPSGNEQHDNELPEQLELLAKQLAERGYEKSDPRAILKDILAVGFGIERVPVRAHRSDPFVRWEGRALGKVREDLRPSFERELAILFDAGDVRQVTIEDCFSGYHSDQEEKIILGVEVTAITEIRTHIIKLGIQKEVSDFDGWQRCVGTLYVGSRLFVRPQYQLLPSWTSSPTKPRAAVIFPNAYLLFGLDHKTQHPESLHDVTDWAVFDDKPEPASVERAISQIYGDLFRWFYGAARSDVRVAEAFYNRRLTKALERWTTTDVLDFAEQSDSAYRVDLRRDAVWLFTGLDRPDTQAAAVYFDPYDFVVWALEQHVLPETLVGRSHGDLHGRNILVGVQRGEVEFPVVFDYGEMTPENVLVWDFVKLEFELKTRLIPKLYKDGETRELLLSRRGKKPPHDSISGDVAPEAIRQCAERAKRLAFAFEFETLLADATARIEDREDAVSREPPGPQPLFAKNSKINCLLRILLRIRQEAALWLGYEQPQRHNRWRDEYYYASTVYGLTTAKWSNYVGLQTECALVASGVACAQTSLAQQIVCTRSAATSCSPSEPCYRIPLRHAHNLWNKGQMNDALTVVDGAVTKFHAAVPLEVEHALLLAEGGRLDDAQNKIEPLRRLAAVFGDFEMLSRLGRILKNQADKSWSTDIERFTGSVPWQFYRQAFVCYDEAFQLSDDYYPGVNAAALAAILGGDWKDRAHTLATRICNICRDLEVPPDAEQRYWLFASEGEASLILGTQESVQEAAHYYERALDIVKPKTQINWAQSSWNQLCRLWKALGREQVDPVARVFVQKPEIWKRLKSGPLNNCGH
jgi:tetratricopeptide (TPR) repeat protein